MRINYSSESECPRRFRDSIHLPHILAGLIVFGITLFAGRGGFTQDNDSTDDNKIELSELDTYLKNKDGTLIQYFNITFEEFESIYNALNSESPRDKSNLYSIRTANVVAKVRSLSAELEIELSVVTQSDGEVEIPLAMGNAFFPFGEQQLIRRNKKFYVRVKGKADQPTTVKIKALQNVKQGKGRKQLQLDLPSATFTTVQIHELDPDQVFSVDQDSISKNIQPFFKNGTAFEFAGLQESALISWAKKDTDSKIQRGTIGPDASITAIVEKDRILYSATFSAKSNEPISSLRIGLPKNTLDVDLNPSSGMILNRTPAADAWKSYEIEFGRQGTEFDDIELNWAVPKTGPNLNLVGFEIFGFEVLGGQLTVRSDESVSFVLANRFNLEQEDRITPNRHYNFSFSTSIFSASVFTLVDNSTSQKNIDFGLRLGSDEATLELRIPAEIVPENAAGVTAKLNGWKLSPNQANLNVDNLLQRVEISPVFFLNENPSRKIEFKMDLESLGEREFLLPQLNDLKVDRYRFQVSCTEELNARFDRAKNPTFELDSQFESEVVSAGNNLVISALATSPPKIKLRLDPVVPFSTCIRHLEFVESRGEFYLESTCTIESSRVFNAVAAVFPSSIESLLLNGESYDPGGVEIGQPFLMTLDRPVSKVVVEYRFRIKNWDEDEEYEQKLAQLLLPVNSGVTAGNEVLVEVEGRNFAKLDVVSDLTIVTSMGIHVVPDADWERNRSAAFGQDANYVGNQNDSISLSQTVLSEEDVHVEQVWCHSSLNDEYRQDRIVIRFVPKRSVVEWKIPEGTKLVGCALDGKPLKTSLGGDEFVVITGFSELFEEHVLEFDLRFFHSSVENQLIIRLPKTNRLLWCQDMYWSVQLPDSHYVLNYSNGLSSSYVLDWTGFFLRPTPKFSVRQLERWIGTSRANMVEHQGNDYLFSTFGIVDDRVVFVISKRNLVLIFGLVFISLGCAFVSLSFMRNALFLVAIAAGILILGMWYPIWFVQLLQIEIFVGFLFAVGFVVSRFANWISPAKNETTIETNVPSLILAAPDSGIEQSAETRGHSGVESKGSP